MKSCFQNVMLFDYLYTHSNNGFIVLQKRNSAKSSQFPVRMIARSFTSSNLAIPSYSFLLRKKKLELRKHGKELEQTLDYHWRAKGHGTISTLSYKNICPLCLCHTFITSETKKVTKLTSIMLGLQFPKFVNQNLQFVSSQTIIVETEYECLKD